jgi:glycosyltransferase involved in cell wall biosynthesis
VPEAGISVVVPHYNRPHLIGKALESIRRQTLPPLEIIVVDDASAPEHRAALQQHSTGARILQLETNVGAAQARNLGIQAASGAFIAFLDDDDEWVPEKLEIQWKAIRSDPALDAVASAMTEHYEDGTEALLRSHSPSIMTLRTALEGTPALLQTLLIRTNVIRRLGGLDPRFRIMEDQEFWVRFIDAGFRALYLPTPLARLNRRSMARLTRDLKKYCAAQLQVVEKHHALYERIYGHGGAQRQRSKIIRRSGVCRGGVEGRLAYLHGCLLGNAWGHLFRLLTTGEMIYPPYARV